MVVTPDVFGDDLHRQGTNGRPLPAPAPGCFPFSIKLSKGRLVLAAPTQTQVKFSGFPGVFSGFLGVLCTEKGTTFPLALLA